MIVKADQYVIDATLCRTCAGLLGSDGLFSAKRSLSSLSPLAPGVIAWKPCDCCKRPSAQCDQLPAEAWAPVLRQLEVTAALQYGCMHLNGRGDNVVLRYPEAGLARRALLEAADPVDELGGVPVNQVGHSHCAGSLEHSHQSCMFSTKAAHALKWPQRSDLTHACATSRRLFWWM